MTAITLHATGTASVDVAWERYAVPALWPSWSPQVSAVELNDAAQRIAAGVRGVVHGPLGVRAGFLITAVDEAAHSWTWSVELGPATLVLVHEVLETPGGCSTTLAVNGPALVVLGYLAPAKVALGRLVRA
jgi:hypothetical protein